VPDKSKGEPSRHGGEDERAALPRQHFSIRTETAMSILARCSGFIAEAGFSHSLTPARNCTFGCSYCYVPTLRVFAGLKRDDWLHWGHFATMKQNAALLLRRLRRHERVIYCSPLVDPYQPAEASMRLMPGILAELLRNPPAVFALQTRGPLVLRELEALQALAERTRVRVSFSVTTDREDLRKRYEPWCATFAERVAAIRLLRSAGLEVYATLAPILPCNPEVLAAIAVEATGRDIICDPLHSRQNRRQGATTREVAYRISEYLGFSEWHNASVASSKTPAIALASASKGSAGWRGYR
jgi:DNA repair photolyase